MCLTDGSVIIPATQIRVCAVDVFSFISELACGFEVSVSEPSPGLPVNLISCLGK